MIQLQTNIDREKYPLLLFFSLSLVYVRVMQRLKMKIYIRPSIMCRFCFSSFTTRPLLKVSLLFTISIKGQAQYGAIYLPSN